MLDTVKINHVQHISFTQSRLTDAVSVILSELLSYEHPSNWRGCFFLPAPGPKMPFRPMPGRALFLYQKDHVALVVDLEDAFLVEALCCQVAAVLGAVVPVCFVQNGEAGGRVAGNEVFEEHLFPRERGGLRGEGQKIGKAELPADAGKGDSPIGLAVGGRGLHQARLGPQDHAVACDVKSGHMHIVQAVWHMDGRADDLFQPSFLGLFGAGQAP